MAMKFRAHETFFIRKGWLSKGMRYVSQKPDVFIDKNENPMDVLGLGSNMVKSLRYWLQAVGLTEEASKGNVSKNIQSLENRYLSMIRIPKSMELFICYNTNWLQMKMWPHLGTIFLTYSLCRNLEKTISSSK